MKKSILLITFVILIIVLLTVTIQERNNIGIVVQDTDEAVSRLVTDAYDATVWVKINYPERWIIGNPNIWYEEYYAYDWYCFSRVVEEGSKPILVVCSTLDGKTSYSTRTKYFSFVNTPDKKLLIKQ